MIVSLPRPDMLRGPHEPLQQGGQLVREGGGRGQHQAVVSAKHQHNQPDTVHRQDTTSDELLKPARCANTQLAGLGLQFVLHQADSTFLLSNLKKKLKG
jgi:hypothetical protein